MIFAACEKVVIGQEDNSGSLISILQGFELPAEPPDDQKVMLPIAWYVFTLWEAPNDEPGKHIQRLQLFAPDGSQLFAAEVPIVSVEDAGKRFHRAVLRRNGFFLHGLGDYMLRLSIKETGEFQEVPNTAFPINVSIKVP